MSADIFNKMRTDQTRMDNSPKEVWEKRDKVLKGYIEDIVDTMIRNYDISPIKTRANNTPDDGALEALNEIEKTIRGILVDAYPSGTKALAEFKFKEQCETIHQALSKPSEFDTRLDCSFSALHHA